MSTSLEESKCITNPMTLLAAAIERNIDPDQLGKLLSLEERWNKNRAAEAFAVAITGFQGECPQVFKSRETTGGNMRYSFASFDDVMRVAGPLLAKHGIVVTFSTEPAERGMKISCRVRVGTHSEESTLTMPIPEMKVNDTQRFGAAVSYLKRYALCAALNIVVTSEDNDAAQQFEYITEAQAAELLALIDEKGADMKRFLAWCQLERLAYMPQAFFGKAIATLKQKKAKVQNGV